MRDREQEKKIIANATVGPWEIERFDVSETGPFSFPAQVIDGHGELVVAAEGGLCPEGKWTGMDVEYNSEFIAAARTGWPEDLSWRERAEKLLRDIQWGKESEACCPACGSRPVYPKWEHDKDCELKALLGEGKQ